MIKLCILTTVHPPFDVRIFHKEAKSLVKAGYDVTLIAQHEREETIDGVKIINLQKLSNRIARMTYTTWSAYKKARASNADLYHFHDPELMPMGVLLKLSGKKIIYDMHENLPKQIKNKHWINPKLRQLLSFLVYGMERILLRGTPVIFAEHSYCKDYPWVKNFETILNLPLANQLLGLGNSSILVDDFSIGYMGGVSNARGSLTTIEALKILQDGGMAPRFECVGPMSDTHSNAILKKCDEYNLNNVTLHGYLPAAKGWQVVGKCCVGLALLHPIPNYYESYPTKIFEYMAMGLPVIASNFPLYRSIIEENNCGMCVNPLDPKAIAAAIEWLIKHPSEAKMMGQRGRKAVEQIYNWDVESAKLVNFYKKLLAH